MKWEHLFPEKILDRGHAYYADELVEDLDVSATVIQANVIGNDLYYVQIKHTDGVIGAMYCECPYALENQHCKHMAAVLYEFDEGNDLNHVESTNMTEDIFHLVARADDTLLRGFLTAILSENSELLGRFKGELGVPLSESDVQRYKQEINDIFKEYEDRHGFIGYYQARELSMDLTDYLGRHVHLLINTRQVSEAFEVVNHTFKEMHNLAIDDSGGGIVTILNHCVAHWQEIINRADQAQKVDMFDWFIQQLDGHVIDYMEEYLEAVLFDQFTEKVFLKKKEQLVDKKLHQLFRTERIAYDTDKWLLRKIELLEQQNVEQSEIDDYCKQYLHFNGVKDYYVERCLERKDFDTAVEVLEESKVRNGDLPGIVARDSVKLKDLYKQTGNHSAYLQELWDLALNHQAGEVEVFNELKRQYTVEEWAEQREVLFEQLPKSAPIHRLYHAEQLYDRLLAFVQSSSSIMLLEYERVLKDKYPEALLERYESIVQAMAVETANRKNYQQIVKLLRKMQTYPDGEKRVADLKTKWQQQYKNRPAMMEELNRL